MEIIEFACGGEIKARDCPFKVGESIMVFIMGNKTMSRPKIGNQTCNCLSACPMSKKASGRKDGRAWFHDNEDENDCSGEPTWYVRCKIRDIYTEEEMDEQ